MHNVAKIVCNTGPLIALAKINLFHLLEELFEVVSIPEAVLREVQDDVSQLQTTGTLGLLLIAKDRGLISQVRPVLDELRRTNFHMSEALYREVLASANEVPQ